MSIGTATPRTPSTRTVGTVGTTARTWSPAETQVLVHAARLSPRRWLGDEWALEVHDSGIGLFELLGTPKRHRDPGGRARLFACGAALANIEVAMRVLGWVPETDLVPSVTEPDRVARVTARCKGRPTVADFARYGALFGRAARTPPDGPDGLTARLAGSTGPLLRGTGVRVMPLAPGEDETLPAAGRRVRTFLQRPEHRRAWRRGFLLTTRAEARHDLVRAGSVAQYLALGSVEQGLEAITLSHPFDLPETRGRLAAALEPPGFPQLLVSVGPRRHRSHGKESP